MADYDGETLQRLPEPQWVTLTHVIYALHALSVISGLSSALIVTAFLTGWPSIVAVILNYWKRDCVRDTYLETHFVWQIQTFWRAVLAIAVGWSLIPSIVGIFQGPLVHNGAGLGWGWKWILGGALFFGFLLVLYCVGLWVLYRIVRGWLRLLEHKPIGQHWVDVRV